MYYILCRSYRDPDKPRNEKDPSEERPKFLVLFSGSCYPKILVSITTDQLARSGLIAGENDILSGLEPENKTDNFSRSSLGCTVLNWIMMAEVVSIVLRFLSP